MVSVFKELEKALRNNNIFDFRISKYNNDGVLTIIGSTDFCYYHNVEINFYGVTYISCPTYFDYATFRLSTDVERKTIKDKLYDGADDTIICIALNEDIPDSCIKHFIVAKDIKYVFSNVYYYKRGNLNEDERLAEWVE